MCGIIGLIGNDTLDLQIAIETLAKVNNRGQEAVGMVATARHDKDKNRPLDQFHHFGFVRDACVADRATFRSFTGAVLENRDNTFIGQTRYSTVGRNDPGRTQPLRMVHPRWGEFNIDHNGQICNHKQISHTCEARGHTFHTNPPGDTEALGAYIAQSGMETLEDAIAHVLRTIIGTYSLLILTSRQLIAARDRLGNKPLWRQSSDGYITYASEIAALPHCGNQANPVAAGSMEIVDLESCEIRVCQVVEPNPHPCIFEDIYFSRPDQIHNGVLNGDFRRQLGARSARESSVDADIVCFVPESGSDAGLGFAEESEIRLEPRAIVRNLYNVHGRSFILPGQRNRTAAARQKYAVSRIVKGRRVLVVDDTLVRCNTLPVITDMLSEAGATEVHIQIASAPVRYPCFGGIDIPSQSELPASQLSERQICQKTGATSLKYLSLDSMLDEAGKTCGRHCAACFSGCYPYPIP